MSACGPDHTPDWLGNGCGETVVDTDGDLVPLSACVNIPDTCDKRYDPVCGCDGVVYDNECYARAAEVDVDAFGGCDIPEGLFPCGYRFCDPETSYCKVSLSTLYPDTFPEYGIFNCRPYPAACAGAAECECLVDEPCAELGCENAQPGLTLTCPAE